MSDYNYTSQPATDDDSSSNRLLKTGVFGPLLLITIGGVLLLNTTGTTSINILGLLLIFWPIFFIVNALDNILAERGLASPLFFAMLGIFIVLDNLDLMEVNIFSAIAKLWPLWIIAIGLDVIFSKRTLLERAFVGLAMVVVLSIGVIAFGVIEDDQLTTYEIHAELGTANQANINITASIGQLNLTSLSAKDTQNNGNNKEPDDETDTEQESIVLISGEIHHADVENIQEELTIDDNQAHYQFDTEIDDALSHIEILNDERVWEFALSPAVRFNEINIEFLFGEVDIDFEDVYVTKLNLSTIFSDNHLILPNRGTYEVHIDAVVGVTDITIPDNMSVKITLEDVINIQEIPERYNKNEDTFVSPHYEAAEDYRIDLFINQVGGSITVHHNGDN